MTICTASRPTAGLSGSYGYDPVGNITTNIESGGSLAYDYGVRRGQAVKTVVGKKYLYDLCGNMIVRRGRHYQFAGAGL